MIAPQDSRYGLVAGTESDAYKNALQSAGRIRATMWNYVNRKFTLYQISNTVCRHVTGYFT